MAASSHCRIGRIRFKRKTRYRSPAAFNRTTSKLLAAVPRKADTEAYFAEAGREG